MTIEGENVWLAAGMGQETKAFAQFGGVSETWSCSHIINARAFFFALQFIQKMGFRDNSVYDQQK
jgi:hypothetical protein